MMEEKKFALLIRQHKKPEGGVQMTVRSENQGIPDPEVIFIVESWLEKVKEKLKQRYTGNITFDNDDN